MSIKGFFKTLVGAASGGVIGSNHSYKENLHNFYSGKWGDNNDAPPEGTYNASTALDAAARKDLLLNNPNIYGPQGSQTYDIDSNSIFLNESDFQKAQRLRQENLAAQLTSSLNGNLGDNSQIQQATFDRGKALIDPVVKQQRKDLIQQLADQGLPAGSEGYNEQLNRFDQAAGKQYTDLSQASIASAEAQRAQRFNEIASLLGTAQIGGTSFSQFQPNFNGVDYMGGQQAENNRSFQSSQNDKANSTANRNALYSSLGSLGAAGMLAFSDISLKENIHKVGISPSGIPIYQFAYKDKIYGEGRYEGVMAHDVEHLGAVTILDGHKAVNYDLIDVNFRRVSNAS